jgi:hypothetical protein
MWEMSSFCCSFVFLMTFRMVHECTINSNMLDWSAFGLFGTHKMRQFQFLLHIFRRVNGGVDNTETPCEGSKYTKWAQHSQKSILAIRGGEIGDGAGERDMKCKENGEGSGWERQSQKSLQKGRTWPGIHGALMLSWQHVHHATEGDEVNKYSTKCRGVIQKIYVHRAMRWPCDELASCQIPKVEEGMN